MTQKYRTIYDFDMKFSEIRHTSLTPMTSKSGTGGTSTQIRTHALIRSKRKGKSDTEGSSTSVVVNRRRRTVGGK